MVAAEALRDGNWKISEQLLINLPIWNLFRNPDKVKIILRK